MGQIKTGDKTNKNNSQTLSTCWVTLKGMCIGECKSHDLKKKKISSCNNLYHNILHAKYLLAK